MIKSYKKVVFAELKTFTMRPGGHTWALFFFLTSYFTVFVQSIRLNSDEYKYVAKEDVKMFKRNSENIGDEYGKKWMWFPGGDEVPHLAVLDSAHEWKFSQHSNKLRNIILSDLVHLVSFTPDFPKGKKIEIQKIDKSLFDPSKPTKVICHGWMASIKSSMASNLTEAYLRKRNVNIIGVDWSSLADNLFYPHVVTSTSMVGKYLAYAIDSLVLQTGAKYEDFHLIGHSLGAHVSGFAGKNTERKIGRITGLDPALPGFQYFADSNSRLDPKDAHFVDVIHTCAGILGMSLRVGHVDFFPNGGTPFQPGCTLLGFAFTQACSHGKSHEMFTESIMNGDFWAIGCTDWDHFTNNSCRNGYARMGEYVSSKVRGAYYLKTKAFKPQAMGIRGTRY